MKLRDAITLAEKIKAQLEPFSERIEIAGSIRRGRPEVGDVDLVILPKPGQVAAIKERCRQKCAPVTDGPQNCIFRLPMVGPFAGVQLDIFFARPATSDLLQTLPGNFGTLLICRTGSKEHNIFLVEHAKRIGLTWNPYRGVIDPEGFVLASETEEDVFAALDLAFVPPASRERR